MAWMLDALLTATDPISAILLGGIYVRMRGLAGRINRLESRYINGDSANE